MRNPLIITGLSLVAALGLGAGIASGQQGGDFWLHCSSVPIVCNEEAVPTVTNTETETETQTVTVTDTTPIPPTDTQPVAAFSYSPSAPVVGQPVRLDASASVCADTPCTYQWADDGPDGAGGTQWPLGSGVVLNFTFTGAHTVWARLTVTDADGDTNAVMHQFQVTTAASPPPPPPPPPPPTSGVANLWIDTNGGTCVRQAVAGAYVDAQACASMSVAYTAALDGDVVRIRNGTYPSQSIP